MESTNTNPKNKENKHSMFHCFKLNGGVPPHRKKKNTDPLLSYIVVAEKHGIKLPTILQSAFTMGKGGGEGSVIRRKIMGKDSFLHRTLMVALNKTPLANKIINRKKTNKVDLSRSTINHIEEADENSNTHEINSNSFSSHCSPAFTPSSLSSSTNSRNSQGTHDSSSSCELCFPVKGSGGMNQKQDVEESRKGYLIGSSKYMYLLSTSLLILVLLGKFCAIFFTSIGFFFVSHYWRRPCIKMEITME